jgi:hypothetical protein
VSQLLEGGNDVQLRGDGMKVAYVLYPDFTALDLVGPYDVTRLR